MNHSYDVSRNTTLIQHVSLKRERESEQECTLYVGILTNDAQTCLGANQTNIRYIEQQAHVTMTPKNVQHEHSIFSLNGSSEAIFNAVMLINNLLKAAAKSPKDVKFKILFDNSLRGKVIGRKGENITRVRNIPNFFCSVENELIFNIEEIQIEFAALNVVGENMQEGIAAALELMNSDGEPRKRRRVGGADPQKKGYRDSSYSVSSPTLRDSLFSSRTPRDFRQSRPYMPYRYKENVSIRERSRRDFPDYRGVAHSPHGYSSDYSDNIRTRFVNDEGSEMYTPYQPSGSSRSIERIKEKRKDWQRDGYRQHRRSPSPAPLVNSPLTTFCSVLGKANQNVFKSEFITVLVSSQEIGGLIGNKGSIVKEINDTHNCFVSITNNFGSFRIACVAFKGFPVDSRFVDVLVDIANRLIEERDDKTLRLMFPLPATRVDTPNGHKVIIDGIDVDVIDVEAQNEAELRAQLVPTIKFLRYICNLVCKS